MPGCYRVAETESKLLSPGEQETPTKTSEEPGKLAKEGLFCPEVL